MKLLIIDDEPTVRGSIKMLANLEALGFTAVEEASDGQEAINKLENSKFDVMITDMRMPVMDGIGLLNSIKESELPATIIVSAYHDFEYMRLAMHKHAVDYLLKPIKQDELIAALQRAASENDKQLHSNRQDRLSGIWWPISGYPKKDFFRAFSSNQLGEKELMMLYARGISFRSVLKQKYGNSIELMYYQIEQSIEDYFTKCGVKHDIAVLNETSEFVVLMDDLGSFNSDSLRDLEQAIATNTGVVCLCDCVKVQPNLSGIYSAYVSVRRKNSKKSWNPQNGQVSTDSGFEAFPEEYLTAISNAATNAVTRLDMASLSKSIIEWESVAFKETIPALSALEGLATAYIKGLSEGLGRIGCSLADALVCFDGIPAFHIWLGSKRTLNAWFERLGKACVDHSFSVKRKKCSQVMKAMLDFVEKNYMLDIGLEDLTKNFFLSREHISRLFKKETGENFITYLTRIRMKKAVRLLSEERHSMQTVAESIGLSDASYFSRSFKKYFGVSPDDYKRKIIESNVN